MLLTAILLSLLPLSAAHAEQPMLRTRAGETGTGPLRTVELQMPQGWRQVDALNRDPVSLAEWTLGSAACTTGASSRLSLYAVDTGLLGPHKLLQKWFPAALQLHVRESERGFALIHADAEAGKPQSVMAYPLSDSNTTPLAGWIGGVQVVLIAESTVLSGTELENVVRLAIRSQKPVNAKSVRSTDAPFVLAASRWRPALAQRLNQAAKRGEPNAQVSLAYALFAEASGFVPAGQQLLLKAAMAEHQPAQLDLLRLARRGLLKVEVEGDRLETWSRTLADAGSDEARFWQIEKPAFDESEERSAASRKALRELAVCGQPEAKRSWAKQLAQSFDKDERRRGRGLVISMMQNPPLESAMALVTRVPRAVEGPDFETLKVAALTKAACPDDEEPEESLFVSKADLLIDRTFAKRKAEKPSLEEKAALASSLPLEFSEPFPELRQASELERLVNSGSRAGIKAALSKACHWSGLEKDRDRLVTEIAARRDGVGRWRAFKACEVISDGRLVEACREKQNRQARINLDARFKKLTAQTPNAKSELEELRDKAAAYFDGLLEQSFAVATLREKQELDSIRQQMESELYDLVLATTNDQLGHQVQDAVTARKLLILPPQEEGANFALHRPRASNEFLGRELARLKERLQQTTQSISVADREDLNKTFKASLASAQQSWLALQKSYSGLISKLGLSKRADIATAASLWFHIEGVYYLELVRDRQLSRSAPLGPEAESVVAAGAMELKSRDVAAGTSRSAD